MKISWTTFESPFGPLTLLGNSNGVSELHFPEVELSLDDAGRDDAALSLATEQLADYFAGKHSSFDIPLSISGTPFQHAVWEQLLKIPCGSTASYSQVAAAMGRPDRVRAVAAAIGRTPVPIIIPCHRVIGANGDLTGYRGGLDRKQALLDHEATVAGACDAMPAGWEPRQLTLI